MPSIACPACGEDERLSGERGPDGIRIACQACTHVWLRDAAPTCGLCGSARLAPVKRPLWAKGRGDQHTPAGTIVTFACNSCGSRDVTSSRPIPARASDQLEDRW